jgi:hypothetical protein
MMYARVKAILDAAAGAAQLATAGRAASGTAAPDVLAATVIYGVAMVASPDTPDREASSGLVIGLRGQFPFDGSQFPPLPWGGIRVAEPDIQLISDWIDAGLPDSEAPAAAPALATYREDPNAHLEQLGAVKTRQDVEHLGETVDPLSSQGILKALRGGVFAAYASSDRLAGDRQAFARYAHFVAAEHDRERAARAAVYARERRWAAAPFWRRRHALVTSER